jgi:hypothetical protein
MRKKLFLVTNHSNVNSIDGTLARAKVNLAAAPWDDDAPHTVNREPDAPSRPIIKPPSLNHYFDTGRPTASSDDSK